MQFKFKKQNKKHNQKLQLKKLKNNSFASNFDVNGSYTGVNSENPFEIPIQDADDL